MIICSVNIAFQQKPSFHLTSRLPLRASTRPGNNNVIALLPTAACLIWQAYWFQCTTSSLLGERQQGGDGSGRALCPQGALHTGGWLGWGLPPRFYIVLKSKSFRFMLRVSEWMTKSPYSLLKGIVGLLQNEFVRKHKQRPSGSEAKRVPGSYCQTLWHPRGYSQGDPDRLLTRALKHHWRTDLIGKTIHMQVLASPKSNRRNYNKHY